MSNKEYIITEDQLKNFERLIEGFGNWQPIIRDIRSRPTTVPQENVHPDRWAQLHDEELVKSTRNATLDAVSKGLQKKTCFNGITWCVSNSDIDEVFQSLRAKEQP
jgi:hypothetical protein